MLEVKAELPGRSVILAGEILECTITLTNLSKTTVAKLAWASAQIHCQCSTNESLVSHVGAKLDQVSRGSDTSFVPLKGEKGTMVLSSKPSILFCELNLEAGQQHTYTYRETIPTDAPPSYRGTAIKYSYKLTIGAQRFNCPTKLIRVPFRVLVAPGLQDISVYQEKDHPKSTNPFLEENNLDGSLLEIAMEMLQHLTCSHGNSSYVISNSKGCVARFSLLKNAFKIGDDIIGSFNFSDSTIPCVQYAVTLQSEEVISQECRKKPTQGITISSYCSQQEMCLHTRSTHINLPIPLTATPTFFTDTVLLRWRLHFEFIIGKQELLSLPQPTNEEESASWTGPKHIEVDTMKWDLPIKIFTTNPSTASSVSLLRNQVTSTL